MADEADENATYVGGDSRARRRPLPLVDAADACLTSPSVWNSAVPAASGAASSSLEAASGAALATTPAVNADARDKEEEEKRARVRAQCAAGFRAGATYREVAERLQLTIGTVQSHIKQARRLGELGDEAAARAKGRPKLINDAVDAMLVRIIQEKGTKSARVIQKELAKPPFETMLSYEVVRRRVKQLIDSVAALPAPGHGGDDQVGGHGENGGGNGAHRYEQVAHDLAMLAETVRSIVTDATQTLDGDDQDGSEENTGEDAERSDDAAFEPSASVSADGEQQEHVAGGSAVNSEAPSTPSNGQGQAAAGTTDSGDSAAASNELQRRSGWPRSTTVDMDALIVEELQADPATTTRAIHAKLITAFQEVDVSFETVRRRVQAIRTQSGLANVADVDEQSTPVTVSIESVPDQPTTSESSSFAATSTALSASQTAPPSTRKSKKGEYSPHTRALCVEKHEVDGMSYASISKELGIPHDSVRAIVRKAKRTGSVQSAPRSGRPRKTSEIVDRVILQAVRANERSSAKAIQESLLKVFNVKVSSETIRRRVLANTRQRLLAISSGGDISEPAPGSAQLDDGSVAADAAASALAAQAAGNEAMALAMTPLQTQPGNAASTSASLLMGSSLFQSEPTPARLAPPPQEFATTHSVGQKRYLEVAPPGNVAANLPVAPETARSDDLPSTAAAIEDQLSQPQQPKKKRAKRREYSVELREKCVAMHEQGEGYRRIGQALDMPHTTVRAIVEKVSRTGSVLPAPRSGRPRKTDEIVDRVILEAVRNNEKCSARMIQEELLRGYGVRISCETIRRRVKDHSRQSLARGKSPLPTDSLPRPRSAVGVAATNQSAVEAALSGSSGSQPPVHMAIDSLQGIPPQEQQQPMQDDSVLQLLPMASVSDSIVL